MPYLNPDLQYTPKHGSWLNMGEIELIAFSRQCLNRRIADSATFQLVGTRWSDSRNDRAATVSWQFITSDARQTQASLPGLPILTDH